MTYSKSGLSAITAHRLDNGEWVVALNGIWCPGVYDSQEAARAAARLAKTNEARLQAIWAQRLDLAGAKAVLSVIDLR